MSAWQEIDSDDFSDFLNAIESTKSKKKLISTFKTEKKFIQGAGKARPEDKKHLLDKLEYLHRGKDGGQPGEDILTPLSAEGKNPLNPEKSNTKFEPVELTAENLVKRAKNVYFSQALKRGLVQLCPDSALNSQYQDSLLCGTHIKKEGERLTSRYCKQRFCNVCNRIRTGQLINTYEDDIKSLKDPYFGTLTIKNCSAEELPAKVQQFVKFWSKFVDNLQKRTKRAKKTPLKGFRKIEITQNAETGEFHPHIHFIIEGRKNGLKALFEWMEATKGETDIQAQDLKRADLNSMKELFKYVTKLLPRRKKINGITQSWNDFFNSDSVVIEFIQGLDVINNSLRGVRTFQNFGFTKKAKEIIEKNTCELTKSEEITPENDDLKQLQGQIYTDMTNKEDGSYIYDLKQNTWINPETGEMLFNPQKIPSKLKNLCDFIDKSHEKIPEKQSERNRINKFFLHNSKDSPNFG